MITESMRVYNKLNDKQNEAVLRSRGPSVILAGAGSGKTRVLIHKVLHLINVEKVNPSEIVMITFTNKAASAMKERISSYSDRQIKLGFVGTYHSFCASVLRRSGHYIGIPHSFSIYDSDDTLSLVKKLLKNTLDGKHTASYFVNRISDAKNRLITPEEYIGKYSFYQAAAVSEIYYQYQKELKKNDALDFDDLIMRAVELFKKHKEVLSTYQAKYKYILVDEFQDTNYAQYVFTKMLSDESQNITVVGDFSQSIYSWRGADITNLQKFTRDFSNAKIFELQENYRSTQKILDFAYEVISENESHPILKLFTQNAPGSDINYHEAENEEDEAIYVSEKIQFLQNTTSLKEIAVLYRTNAQSRAIEEVFLRYGIVYTLIGGTRFYERREIKDILSYLRLFLHPEDSVALERIKKLGVRRWEKFKSSYEEIKHNLEDLTTVDLMEKIFEKTSYLDLYDPDVVEDYARLENIRELKSVASSHPNLVDFLEQVALVESEYFENEKKGRHSDGVRLMTLHQAKGLEFDHVFIVGVEEGILPHSRSIDDIAQLEEERRLFYVGITRARIELTLTYANRRFIFGRRNNSIKSRFIRHEEELPEYSQNTDWW